MKRKKTLLFLLLILISSNYCEKTIQEDMYKGEKVVEGSMILDAEMDKLSSEHQLTIRAKIKTLYDGYGKFVTDIPNKWSYIGKDSAYIHDSNSLNSDIDLFGYFKSNEYFSKELVYKVPETEIENNKLKYVFGMDFFFIIDSILDKNLNRLVTPKEYNRLHPNNMLDATDGTYSNLRFN